MEYVTSLFVLFGYLQCIVRADISFLTDDQHFTAESETHDTLKLPCTVTGSDYNPMSTPVMFYKELDDGEKVEVSQQLIVKSPFKETGRYSLDADDDYMEWYLTITGVTVGDRGTYICEVDSSLAPNQVRHTLTVYKNIEEVTLITDGDISTTPTGEMQFTFERDRELPYSVSCTVTGGHPKPDVSMHLDDQKMKQFKEDEIEQSDNQQHRALEETYYIIKKKKVPTATLR